MKKYETPQLEEITIMLEDIIATSGEHTFGGGLPGDMEHPFPW